MFTFIDLFAGIGGIRIAFENTGGRCVFSSEYDRFAQKTYEAFFKEKPDFAEIFKTNPSGDITKLSPELIPPHDILTGGFPCQPFSLAGVSKKNSLGKLHGFEDPTQGTLFFNIKEILSTKKPKAFFLENVKNLISHNNNNTYKIILNVLDDLGYDVYPRIIDAAGWVPQHRERIYLIGFRRQSRDQIWSLKNFQQYLDAIKPPRNGLYLTDILEDNVPPKYTVPPGTWETLLRHKAYHQSIGHGFGYGLIEPPYNGKITRTLSARYHKDGAEILIAQEGNVPRRLTPLECCRLMGFPKKYQSYFKRSSVTQQPISDTQAYRQFGNSVVVPLVTDIAILMISKMKESGAL